MTGMPTPAKRVRKRRWPKRVLLAVVVVLVLLLGYGTALYFWADSRLRTTAAFTGHEGRPTTGKGTTGCSSARTRART